MQVEILGPLRFSSMVNMSILCLLLSIIPALAVKVYAYPRRRRPESAGGGIVGKTLY